MSAAVFMRRLKYVRTVRRFGGAYVYRYYCRRVNGRPVMFPLITTPGTPEFEREYERAHKRFERTYGSFRRVRSGGGYWERIGT